ncbi:UNVERIFIED_CONTAM: hypothetical protein RMT77_011933 [Armadillidium vulgare]
MVKDRLKELHETRKKLNLSIPTFNEDVVVQVDDGHNGALLILLDKIGPLYARVKELNVDAIELRKDLNDIGKREKLAEKIATVKTEATSLYRSIKDVSNFIESDSPLISHVARTHHLSLVTFFSAANTELSTLQVELRDKHKNYVEKELRITGDYDGQEVTDEELENLLDRQAEIFNQNILMETQVAKQRLLDVQQRHDDVIKIEKSIIEVNQLFQELAILVRDQGEKVDRIERFVYEAQEKAEKGKTELKQAQVNQTKARKKKFIIAGIILIVVVVLILILVLSL